MGRRPDVFILVLDCVSAHEFSFVAQQFQGLDRVERFLHESAKFERAVAVAPWTLPSHASILAGLYPWELSPDPEKPFRIARPGVRTLPSLLRDLGYRSCCLSANCLVSPLTGLTDDFDACAWGRWWDIYVRTGGLRPPNATTRHGADPAHGSSSKVAPSQNPLLDVAPLLARAPSYGRWVSHVVQKVRSPSSPPTTNIAPWIEPTLRRWLLGQGEDTPVFGFLNLLDAHEPYYPPFSSSGGAKPMPRERVPRQDRTGWLLGRWTPSSHEQEALQRLYRSAIRGLGIRLERILSILEECRRGPDPVIVLTSDHGQAFGSDRALFHSHGTEEALLRVPMYIRAPGLSSGSRPPRGWVSLIDIVPTLLRVIGADTTALPSARAIQDVANDGWSRPVFAYSTGIGMPRASWVSPQVRQAIDGLRTVGYQANKKVTVGPTAGVVETFDLETDPFARTNTSRGREWDAGEPLPEVLAFYERISASRTFAPGLPVERRLKSWGY